MNTVAKELTTVIPELESQSIRYTITVTAPSRKSFKLEEKLYVIREQVDEDGVYNLAVAAKMGKEVFL